jgi:hypothetical protein
MTHRLVPLAPNRTFIECHWLFDDAVDDPSYAVDFWELTNRQDWAPPRQADPARRKIPVIMNWRSSGRGGV